MLKSLTTKNFRKLADHQFYFAPGLNVVKGQNEEGKSTLFEAVKYALFGVKACREGLSGLVSWGQPEATLSIELVFEIEAVTYTIYRNKAGAELRYDRGHVTGQAEVGNFVARLLGVPVQVVSSLMLASQNDIRGTIAGGDTDSAKLIETLANLSALDNLVDLIKAKLPCGADVAAQTRMASAKEALTALEASHQEVDTAADAVRQKELVEDIRRKDAETKLLDEKVAPLNEKFSVLSSVKYTHESWANKVEVIKSELTDFGAKQAAVKVPACPDNGDIVLAQGSLDAAKAVTENLAVFNAMTALNDRVSTYKWDGGFTDFETAYSGCLKIEAMSLSALQKFSTEVRLLESQLVTGSVCGYCARDVSRLPEVVAKNAEITAAIVHNNAQATACQTSLTDTAAEKKVYSAIAAADVPVEKFSTANGKLVRLLDTQVPRLLQWVGPDVGRGSVSVAGAEALLAELRSQTLRHSQATGQVASYATMVQDRTAKYDALVALQPTLPVSDAEITKLYDVIAVITDDRRKAVFYSTTYRAELINVNTRLAEVASAAKMFDLRKASLQETITTSGKDIRDLVFNNALVKRVREVRPMVAAHMWNKVMSAVSHYFSQMRGTPSLITKTVSGFQIDGHSLQAMSGSTLDALGLAVRIALTKTFTPHVSLLFIDEAFSSMDAERTMASFSFIAGCGFKQVILITHEDMSEISASNVILV